MSSYTRSGVECFISIGAGLGNRNSDRDDPEAREREVRSWGDAPGIGLQTEFQGELLHDSLVNKTSSLLFSSSLNASGIKHHSC